MLAAVAVAAAAVVVQEVELATLFLIALMLEIQQ
jgi:hypothetical protein